MMNFIQLAYLGKNKTWIFILTTLLVSGLFIINLVFFLLFGDQIDFAEEQRKMMEMIPSKNFWLAANLLPFAFLLGLLFLMVRFVHQRSLLSLTTIRKKVDWKRIAFSFSLIAGFTIVTFIIGYLADPSQVQFQFKPVKFAILFLVSILLFPFQIAMEEYLFRGYLMQQLGILVRNAWMPLLLTSILFGVFHGANPEVGEFGPVVMVFYIGTGLLLGIITLMDDGLELALGFHFGNNLLASILVTSEWSALQTDALFMYTGESQANIISDIAVPIFVVYPIFILIFAKVYKWKGWKEKLFGKISPPPDTNAVNEF